MVISAPGNDGSTATAQALARAKVADGKISEVRIIHPGASYTTPPTVTGSTLATGVIAPVLPT